MKVAQSCQTLYDPVDYTVHGILQARILEWVTFPFSRGSSQSRSPALQVDSLPAEPQGKPHAVVDTLFEKARQVHTEGYATSGNIWTKAIKGEISECYHCLEYTYEGPERSRTSAPVGLMALRESVHACFSCVRPFVTSWTVAHQAPLSMGFSRQEYWSG